MLYSAWHCFDVLNTYSLILMLSLEPTAGMSLSAPDLEWTSLLCFCSHHRWAWWEWGSGWWNRFFPRLARRARKWWPDRCTCNRGSLDGRAPPLGQQRPADEEWVVSGRTWEWEDEQAQGPKVVNMHLHLISIKSEKTFELLPSVPNDITASDIQMVNDKWTCPYTALFSFIQPLKALLHSSSHSPIHTTFTHWRDHQY